MRKMLISLISVLKMYLTMKSISADFMPTYHYRTFRKGRVFIKTIQTDFPFKLYWSHLAELKFRNGTLELNEHNSHKLLLHGYTAVPFQQLSKHNIKSKNNS